MSEIFKVLGLAPTQVRLADSNPLWARLYQEEAARLKAALGPTLLAVEHYGSTSITGIKAKPILDILAGITCLDDGPSLTPILMTLGYDYAGPDLVPGHHIFGRGEARTHLLHVVEYQGAIWNEALQFRDALRADPALARAYEALKIRLGKQFAESRAEYTAGKAAFIQSVLDRT